MQLLYRLIHYVPGLNHLLLCKNQTTLDNQIAHTCTLGQRH